VSTEQNKAIVRRFVTEILVGGNLDVVDELLAPNYVNRQMGDTDLAGFKAMLPTLKDATPERHLEIEELVGEGDAVVARFTYNMTFANGKTISARGITRYRLAALSVRLT